MKLALIFSLFTSASAAAIKARADPELTLGALPAPSTDLAAEEDQANDPELTLGGLHPAPTDLAAEKVKTINPALTLSCLHPAPTDLAAERVKTINPALTFSGLHPAPIDLAAKERQANDLELTFSGLHLAPTDLAAKEQQANDPELTLGGLHPAPTDLAAERVKTINPALTFSGLHPAPTDLAAEEQQANDPELTLGGLHPAPTSGIAVQGKKIDSQSFPTVFTLRVVSGDQNINNQNITAAKGNVQIFGNQNAFCSSSDPPNYAYFYLEDHKLMLYSNNAEQQQLYMFGGNGNVLYANAYYEADPGKKIWLLDHDNHMTLGGDNFRLCKSSTETPFWWLSAQLYGRLTHDGDNAAHNDGYCTTDFVLEAVRVEDPPSCRYD